MAENEVILRFNGVTFEFTENKKILDNADFIIRRGSKITLMGQNGAGKSTIFGMITGKYPVKEGLISMANGITIGHAKQVISKEEMDLTVREYFAQAFEEKLYNLDVKIAEVLDAVNFQNCDYDKLVRFHSGGQQARLLLAYALIADPDILLLDEPTNNLDHDGIEHLTGYLMVYDKTLLVISHDAEFLNSFTDGVIYLDVFTKKVEMYNGNYSDVVDQISKRIERENMKNARLESQIKEQKEKINFFSNKGGKMRRLAAKLRAEVEEAEDNKVDVRREDRTIRGFDINVQEELGGILMNLENITVIKSGVPETKKINLELRKGTHIQLKGPNGIGKTTLLETIANGTAPGIQFAPDLVVGYYRQDFSTLDFGRSVRESLLETTPEGDEQYMRMIAAGFLITSDIINRKIGDLSEGQKGLVAFTHLVLQEPGLLILDEPTNHINFRHLPVIAKALDEFEGAMILVSHVPEFVDQISIERIVDLEKL
jgi:ATP-binding cassette subfamily F protein 3